MSKHTNHRVEAPADGAQEVQSAKSEAEDGQTKREEIPETDQTESVTSEAKIAELEARLADLNDQLLRKAADLENYRKRVNREKQEMADFSNQSLLLDLLPVIDDFGRAIRSAETSKDFTSFYEGVIMIEKRFTSQLENKWGLKGFDSVGEPFDPNRHEALQMERAGGITEPMVKEEYERGYLLKERVIRFAKVKVLMPSESPLSTDEGGTP